MRVNNLSGIKMDWSPDINWGSILTCTMTGSIQTVVGHTFDISTGLPIIIEVPMYTMLHTWLYGIVKAGYYIMYKHAGVAEWNRQQV